MADEFGTSEEGGENDIGGQDVETDISGQNVTADMGVQEVAMDIGVQDVAAEEEEEGVGGDVPLGPWGGWGGDHPNAQAWTWTWLYGNDEIRSWFPTTTQGGSRRDV